MTKTPMTDEEFENGLRLWDVLRSYMRFLRDEEEEDENNEEDNNNQMMRMIDFQAHSYIPEIFLSRRSEIDWSRFENVYQRWLDICRSTETYMDDDLLIAQFYSQGFDIDRNLNNYPHILHILLILDAPCDIVRNIFELDSSLLNCPSMQKLPLHTACEYSPKNIIPILEAYPSAASIVVGKDGFLPIESYLLSGLQFPRETEIARELVRAASPEVLERKDAMGVVIDVLRLRISDVRMKLLYLNESSLDRSEKRAQILNEQINVLWDIFDVVVEALAKYTAPARVRNTRTRQGNNSNEVQFGGDKRINEGDTIRKFPLHAMIENPFCVVKLHNSNILSDYIQRHQCDIIAIDSNGNTPLHILLKPTFIRHVPKISIWNLESSAEDSRKEAIILLTQLHPYVSNIPNGGNQLPIHLAIDRCIHWESGLSNIVKTSDFSIVKSRHVKTRLYPFMAAAANGRRSDLNSIYMLLKDAPELAKGLCG